MPLTRLIFTKDAQLAHFPRISFGMIVLNGEPFLRYNLRALYPYAHEIIVVEGAVTNANSNATIDGHSVDETLNTLQRFRAEEDPEHKLIIITKEGFWDEKDSMSQAYAERATGDYLWQVDSDEFYHPHAMEQILHFLAQNPNITAVSFKTLTFWGAPEYSVYGWHHRRGAEVFHRLFKWGHGYRYVTHRPPTVYNQDNQDLRAILWLDGEKTAKMGIYLYHYALLFPFQVVKKSRYYSQANWSKERFSKMDEWAQENYIKLNHPFKVHNVYDHPSWLSRFKGEHPPQIRLMWQAIQSGDLIVETRQTADIERLLNSVWYPIARFFVQYSDYAIVSFRHLRRKFYAFRQHLKKVVFQ